MSDLSTKPYLLRALYEWCTDSGHTPHIVAWVNEHTRVPMQYVRDNEIMLNIGSAASQGLLIDNDWVHFSARFSGVAHEIWIPVGHIASIFARESGEGMGFEVEPWAPAGELKLADSPSAESAAAPLDADAAGASNIADAKSNKPERKNKNKKGLKLVK